MAFLVVYGIPYAWEAPALYGVRQTHERYKHWDNAQLSVLERRLPR